jgi:hypothetical protein
LSGDGDDASFLALVLQFASLHGLDFAPAALRKGLVAGRHQLYAFGPVLVYAHKGVLYHRDEHGGTSGGSWQPISMPQLLEKAKADVAAASASGGGGGGSTAAHARSSASAAEEGTKSRKPPAAEKPAAVATDDVD